MPRHAASAALAALLSAAPVVGQIRVQNRTSSGTVVRTGSLPAEDHDSQERLERRCRYYIDRAEKFLKEGRYYSARQSLKTAVSLAGTRRFSSIRPRWAELTRQLDQAAREMLAQADEDYQEGEYRKALKTYQRIAVAFAGLPAAGEARARLSKAKLDPELRAALAEVRAAMLFKQVELAVAHRRRLLAKAASATSRPATTSAPGQAPAAKSELEVIRLLSDEKLVRAVEQMERIVKHCRGAPTALKSARYLAALKADPKLKARLARLLRYRRAGRALALAEAYFKADMLEKAAERYREVIKSFPHTPQAEQAGKQLAAVQARLKGPYRMSNKR